MTNKQIIIDGVDVSGCEYYDEERPTLTCTCEEYPCSECPNCHYKQLARKTAKCEELKEKFKLAESLYRACNIKDKKINKLEQAIAEIKEIAEDMNEECFYDDFDCMNCDMQNGCTYFNKKQIIQKIRECKVNYEN